MKALPLFSHCFSPTLTDLVEFDSASSHEFSLLLNQNISLKRSAVLAPPGTNDQVCFTLALRRQEIAGCVPGD
jgi:hypothetical protein